MVSLELKRVLDAVGGAPVARIWAVAFSGGVDSSVVAACVRKMAPERTLAVAVTGVSASLPRAQLLQAKRIASEEIQIQHRLVETQESFERDYVENMGRACFACKKTLYGTMESSMIGGNIVGEDGVLFNGTNKDDVRDATRLGIRAAAEHHMFSPLQTLTKTEVRSVARELGLSVADVAASPCLRSRLAFGVQASRDHLEFVERAELTVRKRIDLNPEDNLRFRMLSRGRFRLEIDKKLLSQAERALESVCSEIGLKPEAVEISEFRSGSAASFQ